MLNVEISRESDGTVTLRQTAYIDRLATEFLPDGLPTSAQKAKTPADESLPQLVADALSVESEPDADLRKRYQSLVGALLYATSYTRPDVAYAVGMLCRAMSKPTSELYDAALRVLTYLVRHREVGLRYVPDDGFTRGYSDSDWAVRRSTTGWVYMLNCAAVSWASKRQDSIALSSCEAEIMAASDASKEAVYLQRFAAEFGVKDPTPISLSVDNKGAVDLAYNPEHHQRTKHIERRHFFVREAVERGEIRVPFVKTDANLADFFTKPLSSRRFFQLRDIIMNVPARTALLR